MVLGLLLELEDDLGDFSHVAGGENGLVGLSFFKEHALVDQLFGEIGGEGRRIESRVEDFGVIVDEAWEEKGGVCAGGGNPRSRGGAGRAESASIER